MLVGHRHRDELADDVIARPVELVGLDERFQLGVRLARSSSGLLFAQLVVVGEVLGGRPVVRGQPRLEVCERPGRG